MATEPEVTDASVVIVSRKLGRPPVDERSTALTTWIPVRHYDRLARLAQKHDVSMSALVRQMIVLQLHRK